MVMESAPLLAKKPSSVVVDGDDDAAAPRSYAEAWEVFVRESERLWLIAAPITLNILCLYGVNSATQLFAGRLGNLQLSAAAVALSVVSNFSFGFLLGMGSALETLCGQAYGAGHVGALGVYMQRSWIILAVSALLLSPLYVFATPILRALAQDDAIAAAAGRFTLRILPQMFSLALTFPTQKFLQAQSKAMVLAWISLAALAAHVAMLYLFVSVLGWGLAGAAAAYDVTSWGIAVAQTVYVVRWCDGWGEGVRGALGLRQALAGIRRHALPRDMVHDGPRRPHRPPRRRRDRRRLSLHLHEPERVGGDAFHRPQRGDQRARLQRAGFRPAPGGEARGGRGHPPVPRHRSARHGRHPRLPQQLRGALNCRPGHAGRRGQGGLPAGRHHGAQQRAAGHLGRGHRRRVAGAGGVHQPGLLLRVRPPAGFWLGYVARLGPQGIWAGMLCGTALQTVILLVVIWKTDWEDEAAQANERISAWAGESGGSDGDLKEAFRV